jgi:hypothetical protein
LKNLLGDELPRGAIFICTNLAQRDSLYEPVVLRQGYSWALVSVSSEVGMQEQLERIKAQIGDNLPEEIMQRLRNPPTDMAANMDRQAAVTMARNIAYAVLQTFSNEENFQFRSSRVGDVNKSPLQDWLDVAIGAYASGDKSAVQYLQENIDMAFPLEDVLFMTRPFVASDILGDQRGGSRGGGGGPGGGQGGPGGGGQGQGGGQRQGGSPKSKPDGGQARTLSKDEQDQRLFDGQAIAFFEYFIEKLGIERMRELIAFVYEKNESWDYVVRPGMLGRDFAKIESDLNEWLAKQPKPEPKPKFQMQQ